MSEKKRAAVDNGRRIVTDLRVTHVFSTKPGDWFAGMAVRESAANERFKLSGRWPGVKPGSVIPGAKLRGQTHDEYGEQWVLDGAGAAPSEYDEAEQLERFGERGEKLSSTPLAVEGLPFDGDALKAYLGDKFKGVGDTRANALVSHFGAEALLLKLDSGDSESLTGIGGLPGHTAQLLAMDWKEKAPHHRAIVCLRSIGLKPRQAEHALERAMHAAGSAATNNPLTAVRRICHYPYRLTVIDGVGFQTADAAAKRLGVQENSPNRVIAATRDQLQTFAKSGHTMMPIGRLSESVTKLLASNTQGEKLETADVMSMVAAIDPELEGIVFPEGVKQVASPVSLANLAKSEAQAATKLAELVRGTARSKLEIPQLPDIAKICGFAPDQSQVAAVIRAMSDKVTVITGGPGTGKTSILRAISTMMARQGQRILLVAPTGRAARRMARVTGLPAATTHRILGATWGGRVTYNQRNMLDCDAILLDEGSMQGAVWFNNLLQALPPRTRVIIIGDVDQLPSVDPGAVLGDLIGSRVLPVVQLNVTHRTEKDNPINDFARNIRNGIPAMPPLHPKHLQLFRSTDSEAIVNHMVERTLMLLAEGEPMDEIVIATPGHNGATGTDAVNRLMQRRLNSKAMNGPRLPIGTRKIPADGRRAAEHQQMVGLIGDRIMQMRNNTDLDLSNGDMGKILEVDPGRRIMYCAFDGEEIKIEGPDLRSIELAYSSTIHKLQGSESRNVLMPVTSAHTNLLRRPLFYTGTTRAKYFLEVSGDYNLIVRAINNTEDMQRCTLLQGFLRRELRGDAPQIVEDPDLELEMGAGG